MNCTSIGAAQAVLRGILFGLAIGSIVSALKNSPWNPIGYAFLALALTALFLSLPHKIVLQRDEKRESGGAAT